MQLVSLRLLVPSSQLALCVELNLVGHSNSHANYRNQNYGLDEIAGGLEYGFKDMFFIRGGYGTMPEGGTEDNIFGFTAGAGIKYKISGSSMIMFDYAYRETKWFDSNQWFTVSLAF